MEFQDVLRGRHSTRSFTDQDVSDELIQSLLSEALQAPSSSNTQSYRVAIAKGELKDQIAAELVARFDRISELQDLSGPKKLIKGAFSGALPNGDFKAELKYPKDLRDKAFQCGKGLYELLEIKRGERAKRDAFIRQNFQFFGAPVAMFVFVHGDRATASALDTGMFMQNLMLAATDRGLGTCAQASVAMWGKSIRPFFKIDRPYKLICGLCLGYPSEEKVNCYRPDKRSVEEICFSPA